MFSKNRKILDVSHKETDAAEETFFSDSDSMPPDLAAVCDRLPPDVAATWRRLWRSAPDQAPPPAAARAAVKELGYWEAGKRGCPNAICRAALFPALSRQTRRYCRSERIYSVRGVEINCIGTEGERSQIIRKN